MERKRFTQNLINHFIHKCFTFLFQVLEVYQFARDAAVAEAWLIAQEPYLMSQELGVRILDI